MSKKIICCLAFMTVLVTCGGCKTAETYPIRDYLSLLAEKAGLSSDKEDHLESLYKWGVVKDDEMQSPDNGLTYDYLALTIDRLIEGDHEDYYKRIQDKGWISANRKGSDKADRRTAEEVIDKAVKEINGRTFDSSFSFELNDDIVSLYDYMYYDERSLVTEGEHMPGEIIYLENDKIFKKIIDKADDCYVLADPSFAEIFESIELSDSGELDLSNAIDIPYGTLEEDTILYENLDRNLLATAKKENTFTVNGFRVSYSIGSNSIDAHISRNVKGINVFFDIVISGIRPSYKWDYKDGKINEAYFKVDYDSSCELGVSTAKYHNYYLDFKDLDANSFLSTLKSVIKEKDDEVAATIRICQIKTPIPEIPTAFFNIEVLAKIYTSGKAEIVLKSTNENGFEIKNGCLRTIGDSDRDIDFIIGGSSRAALGLNFNLEAADHRLMDVEVDGGVRAAVSTTIHLYDEEGKIRSVKSNLPYSAVDDISRENEEVKICGDVSLNWLLEVTLNTSKTLLHKLSLTAKKTILNENDQVFGNKTHIENGTFMSRCTRKDRLKNKDRDIIATDSEKIILERYSAVVKAGESYVIPIKALPEGYGEDDLVYKSSDPAVASVGKGTVKGLKTGSSEIMVSTFDGRHYAALNILVSNG